MKKFAKLQEWFLVEDAAKYLSILFKEEITEAHVLRLALDRRLRLSVYFVNTAMVKFGVAMQCTQGDVGAALAAGAPHSDLEWRVLSPQVVAPLVTHPPEEAEGEPALAIRTLKIGDEYVSFRSRVRAIQGVWDLPIIGGEWIDIEDRYQQLTNGVPLDLAAIEGCIVRGPDGQLCQLQETLDIHEYTCAWNAELAELEQHIVDYELGEAEAEKLLTYHKEERKKFLEVRKAHPTSEFYYPARRLPKNSRLVVRTDALREFEQAINETPANCEKPIATNERNTLLAIIAALCGNSGIKPEERGAATKILRMTEKIGAVVSDETIRNVLAKIPDALETRMK